MFQALTYDIIEMSSTYESPHEVHSYMRAGTTARRLGEYYPHMWGKNHIFGVVSITFQVGFDRDLKGVSITFQVGFDRDLKGIPRFSYLYTTVVKGWYNFLIIVKGWYKLAKVCPTKIAIGTYWYLVFFS